MAVYLSFALTPVQKFITAARSVRDLAVGSRLLSDLVGAALAAGRATGGTPVFPVLDDAAAGPRSIPNQFLLRYPDRPHAEAGADAAARAVEERWTAYADAVKRRLDTAWRGLGTWDGGWHEQIGSYWSAHVVLLDENEVSAARYAALFPGGSDADLGADVPPMRRVWNLLSAALEGGKQVRRFPDGGGLGRDKCALFAGYEQMGPDDAPGRVRAFWAAAQPRARFGRIRLRERDRLCAVALVKRFLPEVAAGDEWGPWRESVPDTAEIATAAWRRRAAAPGADTVGAALAAFRETVRTADEDESWTRLLIDPDGTRDERVHAARRALLGEAARAGERTAPPRYFAVVDLDGDHMGRRLSGDPAFVAPEELTPAFYGELSRRLYDYAARVPGIMAQHDGLCVYAGGDDALGLLPVSEALAAVAALRADFPAALPGSVRPAASASAGLVVAHFQHHLRDVLEAARRANAAAKAFGRDACALTVLKRSGGDLHVVLSWPLVGRLGRIVAALRAGEPDGWVSRLAPLAAAVHPRSAPGAVHLLIRFFLDHSDAGEAFQAECRAFWGELVAFLEERHARVRAVEPDGTAGPDGAAARFPLPHEESFASRALDAYLEALQAAMFFARGKE